jgi:hypothetical protein
MYVLSDTTIITHRTTRCHNPEYNDRQKIKFLNGKPMTYSNMVTDNDSGMLLLWLINASLFNINFILLQSKICLKLHTVSNFIHVLDNILMVIKIKHNFRIYILAFQMCFSVFYYLFTPSTQQLNFPALISSWHFWWPVSTLIISSSGHTYIKN